MELEFNDSLTDEEVYFGQLSLREVKQHIKSKSQRSTVTGISIMKNETKEQDSIEIIKTKSQPNLIQNEDSLVIDFKTDITDDNIICTYENDDSFLNMEKLVNEKCTINQNKTDTSVEELDNTFEEIDNILKKAKEIDVDNEIKIFDFTNKNVPKVIVSVYDTPKQDSHVEDEHDVDSKQTETFTTPLKSKNKFNPAITDSYKNTPCMKPEERKKDFVFKTPMSTVKKSNMVGSAKKNRAFDHITSPVASYIKNSPVVPLLKDVKPKRALPSTSAIPKLMNTPVHIKQNKENVILPSLAYRSAKETKTIQLPNSTQVPSTAKKILSSLPRPIVIRHESRENMLKSKIKGLPNPEDSFGNLSLHQAELSILTQKSAMPSLNHKK